MGRGLSAQQHDILQETYRGHFMRERDKYPEGKLPYGADMLYWELRQNLSIPETNSGRVALTKSVLRLHRRGLIVSVKEGTIWAGCNITAEGIAYIENYSPVFVAITKQNASELPWPNRGGFKLSYRDWREWNKKALAVMANRGRDIAEAISQ